MFEISYGSVTFFLTEETYNEVQRQIIEEDEDMFFWNQLQEVYRRCVETGDPNSWEVYSDLYKDYYGVRP